jgi:hypothetical protein
VVAADSHHPGRRHAGAALLRRVATLGLLGFAVGAGAAQSALEKLAQTGALACLPALPFFCGNTHVSCSGRTTMPTFPFKLRATPGRAWIESDADTSGISGLYKNARIDSDKDGAYVLFRPRAAAGYIKLLADGRYSFRHYAQDIGTMSHGHCY